MLLDNVYNIRLPFSLASLALLGIVYKSLITPFTATAWTFIPFFYTRLIKCYKFFFAFITNHNSMSSGKAYCSSLALMRVLLSKFFVSRINADSACTCTNRISCFSILNIVSPILYIQTILYKISGNTKIKYIKIKRTLHTFFIYYITY